MDLVSTLMQMRARGAFPNYIEYVRLPNFKEMEENTQIDFTFPVTVFIGGNGTRKSSVLKGIQGCPKDRTPKTYWFSTNLDPIPEGKKQQSIIHAYKNSTGELLECLKLRVNKKGRTWDYWETSRPKKLYGMSAGSRQVPVSKNVVYLNFRSLLPAFDKCFYYSGRHSVQDYLRIKSRQLFNIIRNGGVERRGHKVQNEPREILSEVELRHISDILGREYIAGSYLHHKFFEGWADTVVLETQHHTYSEAFAGSGEAAISVLVHQIEKAQDGTLLILDEPEVSLHPEAQRHLKEYLLKKAKANKHQIIMSTHSPFIAEGLPKQAIKAFRISPDTGRTEVMQDISAQAAFSVIGYVPSHDKKIVWVEDRLVKALFEQLLGREDATVQALFEVRIIGSASQMYKDMAHSCDRDETKNYYYVIDGDNRPDLSAIDLAPNERGVCTVSSIASGNMNVAYLRDVIRAQSHDQDPSKIGLNVGGTDMNENRQKYIAYLKFMETQAMYLPGETPEELIWSAPIAANILRALGFSVDEINSHSAQFNVTQDYKKKFELLSKILGYKTGDEILGVQKQFLTAFIKSDPPAAATIRSFINYMVQSEA